LLVSSLSWVSANISLIASSEETLEFSPSYYVKTVSTGASTWRGHTHSGTYLNFTSQPTNTSLVVDSFTRNAPLTVAVAPAFQGWFDLFSAFSKPVLAVGEPEGTDGWKRVVQLKKSWIPSKVVGTVRWVKDEFVPRLAAVGMGCGHMMGMGMSEEEKHALGRVKLVSTRKPATLILT